MCVVMSGCWLSVKLKNGVSEKLPKLYHAVKNGETRICMVGKRFETT